jgi:hypothetical protein
MHRLFLVCLHRNAGVVPYECPPGSTGEYSVFSP